MPIFTSYFGNIRNLDINKCTAICLYKPKWYTGDWYTKVAPTDTILRAFKKWPDKKAYIRRYTADVLDNLDPKEIGERLEGRILLCYEKPDEFCHRHILAEWLNEHGYDCCEINNEPLPKEPENIQGNLFGEEIL